MDGQERKFLLSTGAIGRVREKLGAKNLKEIMEHDIMIVGPPLLWEALQNKGDLTEAQFFENLPADLPVLLDAVITLMDRSYPEKKRKAEAIVNQHLQTNQTVQ